METMKHQNLLQPSTEEACDCYLIDDKLQFKHADDAKNITIKN